MTPFRRAAFAALVCLLLGCAGTPNGTQLAWDREAMCRHCNCLMPAGTDPDSTCTVCSCGYTAHACVRGGTP